MKLYISGPMTGYPDCNYPAFTFAAQELRARGHQVVSPHEGKHPDNGIPGSLPWATYLKLDLHDLLDCEGLVRLPGWDTSKGAQLEVHVASQLEMPVYDLIDVLNHGTA